jgi:hypothetical protein
MSLWMRLRNTFRTDRLQREIDDELESHIAEAVAQGRDPNEARRAFGSPLRHREASRDARLILVSLLSLAIICFGVGYAVGRERLRDPDHLHDLYQETNNSSVVNCPTSS